MEVWLRQSIRGDKEFAPRAGVARESWPSASGLVTDYDTDFKTRDGLRY
jgi:hypothetical protein